MAPGKTGKNCKIKIKNPTLQEILGASEFETFRDMQRSIPVGRDILVKDTQGHFIAKLRKLSFSGKNLTAYYDSSEFGRGQADFGDILGRADQDTLIKFSDGLNILAKSKLLNIPTDKKTTTSDGGVIFTDNNPVDYDPEESSVKIEQFESTTGQDVESERNGTLDPKDSTLAKMELRDMVAKSPGRFRAFIVKDSDAYQNEEGIEPTGEVLLVVHAFAYESLRAEKGRDLTQEELNQVAVKTQDKIHTLPLERSGDGEGSFFRRNHDERVAAYATKYNVSIQEAEKHFRDGEKRMNEARDRANSGPVPVRIKSVSKGSLVKEPMSVQGFLKKFKLKFGGFKIGTGRDAIAGRIYLSVSIDGENYFDVLTVPESLSTKYGADFMWDAYTNGETAFIESLFGKNKRPSGPYTKNGVLMFNGFPIESIESFRMALNDNSWPILRDKVGKGDTFVAFQDGQFVEMTGDEFIEFHTNSDGALWSHKGRTVPYSANRYFYLDIGDFRPVSRISTVKDQTVRTIEDLFRDPKEYDRILESKEPADVAFKKSQPHLFSVAFLKSQSFGRLRKRMKFNPPVTGNLAIPYPVGGKYFGSKSVVTRKINDILLNYFESDLKFPFSSEGDLFANFDKYIREKVDKAIKDGVELNTSESEFNALYTHFSNEFVAQMETSILIPFSNKPITVKMIAPTQAIQATQATQATQTQKLLQKPKSNNPAADGYTYAESAKEFAEKSVKENPDKKNQIMAILGTAIGVGADIRTYKGFNGEFIPVENLDLLKSRINELISNNYSDIDLVNKGWYQTLRSTPISPTLKEGFTEEPVLNKVEATAKVLEAFDKKSEDLSTALDVAVGSLKPTDLTYSENRDKLVPVLKKLLEDEVFIGQHFKGQISDSKSKYLSKGLSEAYHKAKADGSNPELVNAVENLLDIQQMVIPTAPVSTVTEVEVSIDSGNFAEPTYSYWSSQVNPDSVASNFGNDRNPSPSINVLTRPKGEGYTMTWDAFRDFSKANGSWTAEDESAYNKALEDGDGFSMPDRTVRMVYNGPIKSEIDQNGIVSKVTNTSFVADVTITSPNSKLGRQMYYEGYDMAGPIDADSISLAYLSIPATTSTTQTEEERHNEFLKSLETITVISVPSSEEYEYAVNVLGKNFAQRLFSSGQPFTFADIDRFKNDLGKPYSFTKSMSQKEFALSKGSADKIRAGDKTLTLRNPDARYHSKSGLVEIDGEFFDFQELGNINFDEALKRTGMTQQEFTKAFMGEDVGIENIFDPGVKQFFNNESSRRVYQIKKLEKVNKSTKAKSLKSKQKVLPC